MDEHDFDELYSASFARLVRQLHLLTGNLDEATECVQEAFAKAWAKRRSLSNAEHPEAWVRRAAHNLAISRWRHRRLRHRLEDRSLDPSVSAAPGPDHVALIAAMAQLPAEQRRALVLFHIADLSIQAIADETGAPTGTVKTRLARGRATLADLLTDPASNEGASHA